MKNNYINKKGYSVIISLLLIGFLLVLSTGIFRLIINEMNDNRAMGDYIKSYAGAESAQELALLEIKKNDYGFSKEITNGLNNESILISTDSLDQSKHNFKKDVLLSYKMIGKTDNYEGLIGAGQYDIMPLFYKDDNGINKVKEIDIDIIEGLPDDFVWNILSESDGISGNGSNLTGFNKTHNGTEFNYTTINANTFLSSINNRYNYIIIYNASPDEKIKYSIKSLLNGEFFTKPIVEIISTGEVGDYKQNLKTTINHSKLLNILKYSIYSK